MYLEDPPQAAPDMSVAQGAHASALYYVPTAAGHGPMYAYPVQYPDGRIMYHILPQVATPWVPCRLSSLVKVFVHDAPAVLEPQGDMRCQEDCREHCCMQPSRPDGSCWHAGGVSFIFPARNPCACAERGVSTIPLLPNHFLHPSRYTH